MAIDTADKRRAAGEHPATSQDPIADGSITVGDRAQFAWLWPDHIASGAPPAPAVLSMLDAMQVWRWTYDPILNAIRVHAV